MSHGSTDSAEPATQPVEPPVGGEPIEVLVVDDDAGNRVSMEAALEGPDRRIFLARDGEEALRLMLRHDFAVVLLDVHMPEIDGFQVARMMRASRRTRATPIIFITGSARDTGHVFQGYEAGAVDFLIKPVDPRIVRCKVDVFLELYRHRELLREKTTALERSERELRHLNEHLERRVAERTEALTAANRQLEAFVYSASHSLKTPLRSVAAFAEIVLEELQSRCDAETCELLRRINAGAVAMSSTLTNVLRFAALQKAVIDRHQVDLAAVARALLKMRRVEEPDREVAVDLPAVAMADADPKLAEVLLDALIDNAWRFTRGVSAPHIELGVTADTYFVRDNGCGFDREDVESIFRPFERLHDSARGGGAGLGLALVARIAELHGGHAWAETAPGEGATFYFTLG